MSAILAAADYFPEIIVDAIDLALVGETPTACYANPEVSFLHDTIGRHLSVVVLTKSRLIVAHADDQGPDEVYPPALAISTESIALSEIKVVCLSHVFTSPDSYETGTGAASLRLSITWGANQRFQTEPNDCQDPDCLNDHSGIEGTIGAEDITLAANQDISGPEAVESLRAFAVELTKATQALARSV
ncbi:MAG: DUF5998 family protein [Bifidobacteriaceae bacterium]|nr:DUF5998 family protein [Bifidobacteriaceae bacterium]